jgi:hypothetical protein
VMVGGLGSVLTGGTFENGAKTAAYGYLFNALSQAARARIITAGGLLGGTAGAVAAGGCAAGTGGVCALGAPTMVMGGLAGGMVAGDVLATGIDRLTDFVHGNSDISPTPTTVYQLISNFDGSILKYGITGNTDPTTRYSSSEYRALNATMVPIMTFENRGPARVLEVMLCSSYVVINGRLPPASLRC